MCSTLANTKLMSARSILYYCALKLPRQIIAVGCTNEQLVPEMSESSLSAIFVNTAFNKHRRYNNNNKSRPKMTVHIKTMTGVFTVHFQNNNEDLFGDLNVHDYIMYIIIMYCSLKINAILSV